MTTPRHFHFYDMPEVDSLYDHDPAYTRRCNQVAKRLSEILGKEVQVFLNLPPDYLTASVWELCRCVADQAEEILDAVECGFKHAAEARSAELLKLSRCVIHYGLASKPAQEALEHLYTYVKDGVGAGVLGVAS